MPLSRRIFLKQGAFALASVGSLPVVGPAFLRQTVFAADPARASGGRKILICLFQRGAADGLSMVVPHGDPHYYEHRKEIALARPAQAAGDAACLDLDGAFGLHPQLAPLLPLYQAGHLAVIHACGSPDASRSHFDAQDFMESGVDFRRRPCIPAGSGALWLPAPEDRAPADPFRAVSMTPTMPRTLQGEEDTWPFPICGRLA